MLQPTQGDREMTQRATFAMKISLAVGLLLLAAAVPGDAQPREEAADLREQFENQVVGKSIVFVPVSYSLLLTRIWGETMRQEAAALGMRFEVRDPDLNTQRQEQIVSAMIAQRPDVLIVHNPNVQVLAHALKRAQEAGIYVIQVNMMSRFKTDAYVGVEPISLGRRMAQDMVEACSGGDARSNKVAIMNGELTSAFSIDMTKGATSVLDAHPGIRLVSTQAANWNPKLAHDKAATVLQAHPDLCAYMGFWSGQDVGIAQAVRQAGLQGKVKIFTADGGEPPACEYVRKGLFYRDYSYDAVGQARQMMAIAKFLLQSNAKPGSFHTAIYSPVTVLTKDTVQPDSCASVGR